MTAPGEDVPAPTVLTAITTMAAWSDTFGTADQLWGSGGRRAVEWADRVERTRSYQTAVRHRPSLVVFAYGPV